MSAVLQGAPTRVDFHTGIAPSTLTSETTGSSVDFGNSACDGPTLAVLSTGTVAGGTEVVLALQESSDGQNWDSMTDGVIDLFTPDGVPRSVQARRTARYVRCVVGVEGTNASAVVSVLLAEGKKYS